MIVVPAIDLRGGRVVRLVRGDPASATRYGDDPVEAALRFQAEGAALLHVVDLDAALEEGDNRATVEAICNAASIPVQVGGGLRSPATVAAVLAAGAARAILGTAAVADPRFVTEVVDRHGEAIVVALDVRGGKVMVRGWRQEEDPLESLLPVLDRAGAPRFLITSVDRDGTGEGPDLELYRRAGGMTSRPVLASGGVATKLDLRELAAAGVEGAVVGRALYEGALTLGGAISEAAR